MNNWTVEEMAFRCDRLPIRIDRLTQNILNIGSLSKEGTEPEATLAIIRQTKAFIELTAIDLDIDRAFELAQIQRQLSQWHIHWPATWTNQTTRSEISTISKTWATQLQEMSGVVN